MAEAGFSEAYGRRGIACVARESAPFAEAFNEELEFARQSANGLKLPLEDFQKLVEWRIAVNVVRGKDDGVQSAKLAGQLKRLDMFVRTGDETRGIFAVLLDPKAGETIDSLSADLPDDKTSI